MNTLRTAVAAALIGVACCAAVAAAELDEYGVKSAFVYNFLQFIDWPAAKLEPAEPLSICVFQDHPITQRLSALSDRVVKGHPIRVRSVIVPADAGTCHVLFVAAEDSLRLPELAVRHRRSGLLFIGESIINGPSDASITLVVSGDKITFDVNLSAAAAQGLTISSKLLQLARDVFGAPGTDRETSSPGRRN